MGRTRRGERKRGTAVVLAIALAAAALVAVLGAVAQAAPRLAFLHIRRNLSQTRDRFSAYPDLAVSPDGDRVAVVWTERFDEDIVDKGHVYLRAASESGGGWGDGVRVFTGTRSACAYRAAVAVTGTTAHVAYVVYASNCAVHEYARVSYRTCSLTTGRCGGPEEVAFARTSSHDITWVDLALDVEGNPHVVWMRYEVEGGERRDPAILYRPKTDGGWGGPAGGEVVASGGVNRNPAIAYGGGYVHVVWQEESGDYMFIRYRRRPMDGQWEPIRPLYDGSAERPPRNPDVAAGTGRLFAVWDVCRRLKGQSCEEYVLLYKRSDTNGEGVYGGFGDYREVGTDVNKELLQLTDYAPTGVGTLPDLQPSIALNRDGWPIVVWHAGVGEDTYAVYYSYALSGTMGYKPEVNWAITPTVLVEGPLGAATVGVGEPEPGGEQHLHVAYMRSNGSTWDVYYDSNEADRYERVYLPLIMRGD
jgi:hypothetical protein